MQIGEVIKVDTRSGEYVSRVHNLRYREKMVAYCAILIFRASMMKRFICLVALVPSTGTLLTACNTARASAKIFSIFYHAISRAAS